jgi:hypothetical protein
MFAVTSKGGTALADSRTMRDRLWRGIDVERLTSER